MGKKWASGSARDKRVFPPVYHVYGNAHSSTASSYLIYTWLSPIIITYDENDPLTALFMAPWIAARSLASCASKAPPIPYSVMSEEDLLAL